MISTEQPLKKRRLFDHVAVPPEPPHFSFSPTQGPFFDGFVVPPLLHDQILTKRKNIEEIRNIYDCYKKIRFCISHKDAQFDSDLEQAYLSLITSSRGCPSVQRIVADLIPRYASYCPTALEAATKVVINMHNWSLALMGRGGETDCVAFETAKTCILGLADICGAVSTEDSSSSVIRGICSAVFLNTITFLIPAFNGVNIFQIVDKEIWKTPSTTELLSTLQQKIMDKDESTLIRLSKFRILSFLRILLSYPKNSLAACFELLGIQCAEDSVREGSSREGSWFLNHLTTGFGSKDGKEEPESCETSERIASDGIHISDSKTDFPKNCLLGLVLEKNLFLRRWLSVSLKKLSKSIPSQTFSEVERSLEGFFGSSTDLLKQEDAEIDNDENCLVSSTYMTNNSTIPQTFHETSEVKAHSPKIKNDYSKDITSSEYFSAKCGLQSSVTVVESGPSTPNGHKGSISMGVTPHGNGDLTNERSSISLPITPIISPHKHESLPISEPPSVSSTNPLDARKHLIPSLFDSKPQIEDENNYLVSPILSAPHPKLEGKIFWYYDGDPASMNIFPASKQLWLGFLGPEASEALIRFQFERFGPLERLFFFPAKSFALLEYKNVMDAVNAREHMQGCSIWGASIIIKFMDAGMGSRGFVNGVAVGSSCHVFVGNVLNIQAKDEILHESMKVIYKGPKMVSDHCKGALILEFETPEDSCVVMNHLRSFRHASNKQQNVQNGDVNTPGSCVDIQRNDLPQYTDFQSAGHGGVPMPSHSVTSYKPTQMGQLSSMIQSLCSKYNITPNSSYCASSTRDADGLQPTQVLRVSLPKSRFPCLTDSEVMHVLDIASGSAGAVSRLTRVDTYMDFSWFVECISVDDAVTILKNLKSCPAIFLKTEYSSPQYAMGCNSASVEAMSPRMRPEAHGTISQNESAFQQSFTSYSRTATYEPAPNVDLYYGNMVAGISQGGAHGGSRPPNIQTWTYGSPGLPLVARPTTLSVTSVSPFRLPSVTPLFTGPRFDPSFSVPVLPPPPPYLSPSLPVPMADVPHSLPLPPPPPSLPPLPASHPPSVPPPPCSPPLPPPPPYGTPDMENFPGNGKTYQWKGQLCKRGFHYATVYAERVDSNTCNYSNGMSEPVEWPGRLDMTKRTDVRHFKTAFSATSPNKREICWLLPCSTSDLKGFRDFMTYLKQRECAGVIKVAGVKPLWARLIFMVLPSSDICSLLSLDHPPPPDSVLALILPKENDF